jgi:hypothetical protein
MRLLRNTGGSGMCDIAAAPYQVKSYKLQVLRIRSKAVACLSLRSSVRKLRKGVNEPRLTSQ